MLLGIVFTRHTQLRMVSCLGCQQQPILCSRTTRRTPTTLGLLCSGLPPCRQLQFQGRWMVPLTTVVEDRRSQIRQKLEGGCCSPTPLRTTEICNMASRTHIHKNSLLWDRRSWPDKILRDHRTILSVIAVDDAFRPSQAVQPRSH